MPVVDELPLTEVRRALEATPETESQLRAALATTLARWCLLRGDISGATDLLSHALEMVPDLRPAMRLLYRVHLDRNDVRTAVLHLDQEIRATRHPREAAALYRERGQLVEASFHDLAAAQQCYQAALKATPRDLAVLRAVERVSLARGDFFWLIANLETQLEVVTDPAATAGLLHELGLLETRHKGDLALGGDLLIAALAHTPGRPLLAEDMFRTAEAGGDTDLMLRALEAAAESRPPEHRAMPLARSSVVLRELKERSAALELLKSAARAQPHNVSLWRSLEELAMATGRYEVALEACVRQLEAVGPDEDRAARAELYYRLGKLALFRLDRSMDGLNAMRKALRLLPGHVPAIEDTGRFLNAGGLWAQLLELVKLEVATAVDAGLTSEEVALAHLRAGQILEERLGELSGAREYYEKAIAANPAYRPAHDRLERLLHQAGDAEGLREYYAAELEHAATPARQAFLLGVLAKLHAPDDDPKAAIGYLVARLKQTPDHLPSIQQLARLLSRADRPKDLLRVTEQEITLTESPGRKAKLLHRAGELALEAGDPEKARGLFAKALEVVDDHLPSLERLGDLLRDQGHWEELVELLRKKLLYANDRARQVGLQLEIATILSARLGRPGEALEELRALLRRWPRHLPALHAAERIAEALEQSELLVSLLEQHIATVSGPRTRALLLHRVARLRARAGNDEGAIRDLVRALELWPQLGVARALLLRLYEKLGRSRELQAFAEAGLTSERGADDRRAMALQLAELSPKPVVAIQYLGTVAEARPEDYVTQLRLARACRQAGRPSRQAGALAAAAEAFAGQMRSDDPYLLALVFRAARAEEAAGNLDRADQAYARILDRRPGHELAHRGRLRIKERKRESSLAGSASDLEAAAKTTTVPAEKAAYLTIAADLHERRNDNDRALDQLSAALQACPGYLPALHARARILERRGALAADEAMKTLCQLADRVKAPRHRARALARAGTLALRWTERGEANPQAWEMFAEALAADPGNDRAFRGLRRTRAQHGTAGAPSLRPMLEARLSNLRERGLLDAAGLRELSALASDLEGPEAIVTLLEAGMDVAGDDPGVRVDLAQALARVERWGDAVGQLEDALSLEVSPERRAALHFYAGDAHERAGDPGRAVDHYLAAGRAGFHPRHALTAADRCAQRTDDIPKRVEALGLLVEAGAGPERVTALRALAELHRGPLGEPDVAVERMRELLLLRPTDVDVVVELARLLEALGRRDEATAALLAGVAHHRAWLRASGLHDDARREVSVAPVRGLLRLFEALGDGDGAYLCTAVLETFAPTMVVPGRGCDALMSEPWPLPRSTDARPFDSLVGDLPGSAGLDLLREGNYVLTGLPDATPPGIDISKKRSLPANSAVVMVARALGQALGVAEPQVFVDPRRDDGVTAHVGDMPFLVVGRRINSSPFGPPARDLIGRALLRLATGGDALHYELAPAQVFGLVVALCRAAGVEVDPDPRWDEAYAQRVREFLQSSAAIPELAAPADILADGIERFDPEELRAALRMAEDRAAIVCSADPRPALAALGEEVITARGTALVGYLLSDDHLTLRRSLRYLSEHAPAAGPVPAGGVA
jgi:tetratricopeptide (TPR) repeat protein